MNGILAFSLITTCVLAVAGLLILALAVAGIHREESRLSLPADPRSHLDAFARHILGAHVSLPGARQIITGHHPSPQDRRSRR